MNKTFILLIFLFSATLIQTAGVAPCPRQYDVGSVFSAKVIVSNQRGLVPLINGQDTQCYNFSLPYKFARTPQVAISVHEFSSERSDDLFFAIKPIHTTSHSFVPFVVRTQWKYTTWNRIVFSFVAEDRGEIEAGYYQVDAGALEGCEVGKEIQALLPFREITGTGEVKYNLYLHGFEISSQKFSAAENSPFEIQIAASNSNSSGISILFTVTTITQVHAIHISYFAFYQTTLDIVIGTYTFDASVDGPIEHIPYTNIGRNYARLHGLAGFIINHNNQDITFKTKWTGAKFVFDLGISQRLTKYLSYYYLFLMGSQCSDCPGYPITHLGRCVRTCPIDYFVTPEKICMTCGDGQHWNGTACQKTCPQGQFLNKATNECQCPDGLNWNGQICISCKAGKVFNKKTNLCECPPGLRWNGYGCANVPQCSDGKKWNVYTYSCECPLGAKWNGTYCAGVKNCFNGKILKDNECVCPENTYWNGNWCQDAGCTGGQEWDGKKCICPGGLNFNGTLCVECINGQIWNPRSKSCVCEKGYKWNGNFCKKVFKCSGGRVYNETFQQCVCKEGNFWNGYACMVQPECCCGKRWNEKKLQCECPESFNWDGQLCVQCINGKVWDQTQYKCICRPGTQWNGQFCVVIQSCQGGMMWNQNTWTCQCPSTTVWNGKHCMQNPCQGGKIWDNHKKTCICVGGKIFYEGKCVPPQVSCKDGKIWDETSYTCVCPDGTWDSGSTCQTITVCKSNQIYNPLNNKCECAPGFVWLSAKNACGDPTCQVGQRWDGHGCVEIACPPGSFYNGTQCICPGPKAHNCKPWQYFNGVKCVYFPEQCPHGTEWNKTACVPINNGCPIGSYGKKNHCKNLPQQCGSSTVWIPSKKTCKPKTGHCPSGTYLSGSSCQPYVPCQHGQTWNPKRFMCLCPDNTEWNGEKCLPCTGGKIWVIGKGCECREGQFFSGSRCQIVNNMRCANIPNSFWKNGKCECKEGFDVVGMQCLCDGVIIHGKCDRCAHVPNSQWHYGRCKCIQGFTNHYGKCIPNSPGNDDPSSCSVGTYFDSQQRKCLACPDGCLTCNDCYTCKQCRPEFNYDPTSQLCLEHCGDGKKFILECDDGNNIDGDGCSMDCKVEPGYTCRGGSPNNKDSCLIYQPAQVTLTQTGQIRYQTKIVLNIKVDYLPKQLLQSEECNDRCSAVIMADIKEGDKGALSVKSKYIPGSSYSFSVQIDFGRSYIGTFKVELKINPVVSNKFFGSVGTSNVLVVEVQPGFLSKVDREGGLQ